MTYVHPAERSCARPLCFLLFLVTSAVCAPFGALGSAQLVLAETRSPVKVIFFGDSLTAGYGLSRDEAFPARIREYAARDGFVIDVVNAGASGDTTAGGLRRLDWVTREKPDVFVLALGANDGLRGLDMESMKSNLSGIVRRIRGRFPTVPILLLPMELPPTFGQAYVQRFRGVYSEVARETAIVLGPFLLEQVAGRPELNLPDGLHPNARGHELVAQTVWPALKSVIVAERASRSSEDHPKKGA